MSEKILIFGASGRVGAEVINALPESVPIRATYRQPAGRTLPPNVEAVAFDFDNPPADMGPLFDGVKRIFLLWPPGASVKQAVLPVLEAAQAAGVVQVVFLSILGAERLRIVPHRAIEQYLENSGMGWVFLRAAYFMQNLSGIHAYEIEQRDEIFVPAGKGTLGLIDARDVAAIGAQALLADEHNRAYALTGAEALSFSQMATALSRVLGRQIRYDNPSILRFVKGMRQRGIANSLIGFMIIEYTATKIGRSGTVTTDTSDALGRAPTSFEQFAADYRTVWMPEKELSSPVSQQQDHGDTHDA